MATSWQFRSDNTIVDKDGNIIDYGKINNALCIVRETISGDTDVNIGKTYLADTSDAAFTITLPSDPNDGDIIIVLDYLSNFGTNAVTATTSNNDHTINSGDTDVDLDIEGKKYEIMFNNNDWKIYY